jgi:hypothetical protein
MAWHHHKWLHGPPPPAGTIETTNLLLPHLTNQRPHPAPNHCGDYQSPKRCWHPPACPQHLSPVSHFRSPPSSGVCSSFASPSWARSQPLLRHHTLHTRACCRMAAPPALLLLLDRPYDGPHRDTSDQGVHGLIPQHIISSDPFSF